MTVARAILATCLAIFAALPAQARAEMELSIFGGQQWAAPSQVTVSGDSIIPDASFRQEWAGYAFEWPIYVGVRLTRWRDEQVGFGVEYVHNKTVPPDRILPPGYRALEFSDGLNSLTLNAYHRWPDRFGALTPYVGAGLGISFPGVEIRYGTSDTFEYQITGVAATWMAGLRYPIRDRWSGFAEYRGSYSTNDVRLTSGGMLSSNFVTSAVNFGLSYGF